MTREDFSATVQELFEEEMINKRLSRIIKNGDAVFCSGGLFLNSRCNQKLRTHFHSAKLDFFPDSGDSGLSVGCALAATKISPSRRFTPFAGRKDGFERLDELLLARDGHYIRDVLDLPVLVAQLLHGKFLGLCAGRSEIGPRALGSRSMIANAFSKDLRFDLNKRKKREMFVPVAPSVLVSDADKLMHSDGDEYYMLKTVQAKSLMMEIAPGLVHADGSVRPQLVDDDDPSLLASILREVKKEKGIGLVANSSLNRSGFPTAGDIEEAIECLEEGLIDILVNQDVVIRRRY